MKSAKVGLDEHTHRHCVSPAWMRSSYGASSDYVVCDITGCENPNGTHYISRRTKTIKEIKGFCTFQELENGEQNPAWTGCPVLGIVEVDPTSDRLADLQRLLKESK